jgi:competence protein ComEA
MLRLLIVPLFTLALAAGLTGLGHAQESPAPAASSPAKAAPLVNLNTATAEQLESLPGIGARTAERIVEYRQKNGPFKKVEDLMNVRGVGEKSFLRLKPLISVGKSGEKPAAD